MSPSFSFSSEQSGERKRVKNHCPPPVLHAITCNYISADRNRIDCNYYGRNNQFLFPNIGKWKKKKKKKKKVAFDIPVTSRGRRRRRRIWRKSNAIKRWRNLIFCFLCVSCRVVSCSVLSANVGGYTHYTLHSWRHNPAAAAPVKKQSFNLNNQSAVTNQTFHLPTASLSL